MIARAKVRLVGIPRTGPASASDGALIFFVGDDWIGDVIGDYQRGFNVISPASVASRPLCGTQRNLYRDRGCGRLAVIENLQPALGDLDNASLAGAGR